MKGRSFPFIFAWGLFALFIAGPLCAQQFGVTIQNNTPFDIEIIDESRLIPSGGSRRVMLPSYSGALNDGYSVTYRIPLADGVFIRERRRENIIIKSDQRSAVVEGADFDAARSFLVLANGSRGNVSVKRPSENEYLNPLVNGDPLRYAKTPYLSPGARGLYELVRGRGGLVVEGDQYRRTDIPLAKAEPGYIYRYRFTGNAVELTDVRPLSGAGQSGWVMPLPGSPLALAAGGGITAETFSGESVVSVTLNRSGDTVDTETLRLPVSDDYSSLDIRRRADGPQNAAVFAGSALKSGYYGDGMAYVGAFRNDGGRFTRLWEIDQDTLDSAYGAAAAAAFDKASDRYRVAGAVMNYDDMGNLVPGSYLLEIDAKGKVLKKTALDGVVVNALFCGGDGTYYLAGDEERNGKRAAAVWKYDKAGKLVWKSKSPPEAFSSFHAIAGGAAELILGGAARARNEYGSGGMPFIQCLDAKTGVLLWQADMQDAASRGANAVLSLVKMPDYGYAAALRAVDSDGNVTADTLARVNERGAINGEQ